MQTDRIVTNRLFEPITGKCERRWGETHLGKADLGSQGWTEEGEREKKRGAEEDERELGWGRSGCEQNRRGTEANQGFAEEDPGWVKGLTELTSLCACIWH